MSFLSGGIKLGMPVPTRAKMKEFLYHYQRCASYSGTSHCPGLLLPGTRDTDLVIPGQLVTLRETDAQL